MDPLAVGLDHRDPVLPALEYLNLVHREDVGPGEVPLSVDVDFAVEHIQCHGLVEISVLKAIKYLKPFSYFYTLGKVGEV